MKKKKIEKAFLPVSKDEMVERGWYYYDFLVVTADAYICLLYTSPSPRDRG